MNKGIEAVKVYLFSFPKEIPSYDESKIVEVSHHYILNNDKYLIAILGTDNIFEVTFNSDKEEVYIDRYVKSDHRVIF